jgi:nucleotidyltransferase/DNA polymerase involved in DNA repair
MSRDGGESQLKSLQNVDKSLLHKLKGVGIESISDLATTTASELLEDYYSNYDESARGMDFETISQLVLTAKQKLIDDGLLQAGVNDISSIYFSLSDEKSEAIKSDLLKQAVTNAK